MVTKHRFKVFVLCTKCGLFWRGLVHDLSKFSPVEFWESVRYYTGKYSPVAECRNQTGYSNAWLHHKGRNKHHIEYWYDQQNKVQMNIPYKYSVEHICDNIAAAKCYLRENYTPQSVLDYWTKYGRRELTNDNMNNFFVTVYTDLSEHGEKYVLNKRYLKEKYKLLVLGENK